MDHLQVDLCQVCSYDATWVKTGSALGVTSLNIGTRKETSKFFFCETGKCKASIFGVYLLVDLDQVCSNKAPGVKTGLCPGDDKIKLKKF